MVFTGYTASIPNNDRTAQTSGAPGLANSHRSEDHNPVSTPQANTNAVTHRQVPSTSDSSVTAHEKDQDNVTPGPETPDDDDDSEQERRSSIVRDLARQYTRQSTYSNIEGNPFEADKDSPLNPQSDNFRALAWAKSIVHMMRDTGHEFRKAGVCYQNLNVFGYGEATDYQKNVANILFEAAAIPRRLLGQGLTKIDILRNFDGVVRNGEMLVVLGPPGSGCSTFLKTIAGETNGLYVNDDSYFNYQGKLISPQLHPHIISADRQ